MDILFPGPESYRKEKKKKPNSDQNTPPISDNTCQAIPPSKAEEDWKATQVKIIKPVPLTAETPHKTSLTTSHSSDKSSTPKPTQTNSKFFSKNGGILKKKKDAFLDTMVSECAVDPKKDEDNDVQLVSTDEKHTEFFFKPLTKEQKIKICKRTSLIYRKDIKNNLSGDKLGNRTPIIRQIKGDGNCFFRAMSVSVTGWEVGHLAIPNLFVTTSTLLGHTPNMLKGKLTLTNQKMKTPTVFATNIEIMAAAQVFGTDIYVYHTYGNSLKWLRFPCVHTSSLGLIYLDNQYGDGKTGHFDYVTGLM